MIIKSVKYIVGHCSATEAGQWFDARDIRQWHLNRKPVPFSDIGYHFVILLDGQLELGSPLDQSGAHVRGHNFHSLAWCYIGGLVNGNPADTRTSKQKQTERGLLTTLLAQHPLAKVNGHRDFSPDLDGNGIITPNEYIKDCPCYDVQQYYSDLVGRAQW